MLFVLGSALFSATSLQAQVARASSAPVLPINNGDNAWILISTAFVLMMTAPGLILCYGGWF